MFENVEISDIISGIALIAAILSPVITAVIQNSHESKMHKQKFYDEHRATAIENYIKATGTINHYGISNELLEEYGKYSKEIYLYAPEYLWKYIEEIDGLIKNRKFKDVSEPLAKLCIEFSKDPPRFKKHKR